MMKYEVKNRFSGSVQFTAEIECAEDASVSIKLGLAVKWAMAARANLAGAYLAGANLAGADLADANLAGAYLAGANLARADLAGADLAGAYLAGANLAGAYLAGANLADANLARADLAGADLAGARNLPGGATQTDPPEPYELKPAAERYTERAARCAAEQTAKAGNSEQNNER